MNDMHINWKKVLNESFLTTHPPKLILFYPKILHTYTYVHESCLTDGCTNFSEICATPENSGSQIGDVKQVPY